VRDRGFVLRHERGKNIPAMVCEKCGEIIDDYVRAGVVWARDNYRDGGRSRATVLCQKNGCLAKEPYNRLPWQPMQHFLLWLAYNSGLKTEKRLRDDWKQSEMWSG